MTSACRIRVDAFYLRRCTGRECRSGVIAELTSDYRVLASRVGANDEPEFDHDLDNAGTVSRGR